MSTYSQQHMKRREEIVSRWMREMEAFVELRAAAAGAELKMRTEYHVLHPDAPAEESWAEGERLWNALKDIEAVLGEWRPSAPPR